MNPDSNSTDAPVHDEFAPDGPEPAPATRRALRYRMLCLLWIFPSLGALGILANDARQWLRPVAGETTSPGLESWLALGLIAAHILFALRAWRSRADLPGAAPSPPPAPAPRAPTGCD